MKNKVSTKKKTETIWTKYLGVVIALMFVAPFIGMFFASAGSNESTYQPMPTIDPDPYILCNWGKSNGQVVCADKRMRKSDCDDSVCCSLGNNTWSPLSKVECAKTQAELESRKPVYVRQPIRVDIPQMKPVQPPNVSCNYDSVGNWVCKPSW